MSEAELSLAARAWAAYCSPTRKGLRIYLAKTRQRCPFCDRRSACT